MRSLNKGYFFASLFFTIVIWFNAIMPANISSEQSGFIVDFIHRLFLLVNLSLDIDVLSVVIRKLAHFGQFFVLGLLWFKTFDTPRRLVSLSILMSIIICYVTAMLDETIQLLSDGRVFSLTDILIDQIGATVAIFILARWSIKKKRENHSTMG